MLSNIGSGDGNVKDLGVVWSAGVVDYEERYLYYESCLEPALLGAQLRHMSEVRRVNVKGSLQG
jgi:hypothetical protein